MARRRISIASLFAGLAITFAAWPCTLHEGKPAPQQKAASSSAKTLTPLWVGPAFSGSWFTPSRNGEGFTLQILDDGTAYAFWFTYPPAGAPGAQAWIVAQGGRIEGDRIRFDNVFTTRGPRFGPTYDPRQVQVVPWGTLEFRFLDCNRAEVAYAGPAQWGSGTRDVVRLTALTELECAGKRKLATAGNRTLDGLRMRSGAWFDPAHNGEGWKVEELPDGRAQVYWFTYDENGEQAWTIGIAPTTGDTLQVQAMQPVGTRFGSGFAADAIAVRTWGTYSIAFDGCERGTVNYQSALPAYGSGTLRPVRLTRLAGAACVEGTPQVPSGGTWSAGASMPTPQSETAMAAVGAKWCTAGGYAAKRDFKCYDPAANFWTTHAELPGGRDHAIAVTLGAEMYVVGGYSSGATSEPNGWRYKSAENRWEALPQLPLVVASGAAVLGGFAYLGDIGGDLVQVNPATLEWRRIRGDSRAPRDHSQVIAFQGEIWMIGGRPGVQGQETAGVSIYDPASETWRAGPTLGTRRAGFAVAATPTAIIVAGGERIVTPLRVLSSVEAIAAGDSQWRPLPDLPFAMHGFTGFIHGNSFITLGGSRVAATAVNEGQVQIYRWQ